MNNLLKLISKVKPPKIPKLIDNKGNWLGIPKNFEKQHLEYIKKIREIENEYKNKNNIVFSKL